jgi:hypothetical protein
MEQRGQIIKLLQQRTVGDDIGKLELVEPPLVGRDH